MARNLELCHRTSKTFDGSSFPLKAGVTVDTCGNAGFSAGIGWQY